MIGVELASGAARFDGLNDRRRRCSRDVEKSVAPVDRQVRLIGVGDINPAAARSNPGRILRRLDPRLQVDVANAANAGRDGTLEVIAPAPQDGMERRRNLLDQVRRSGWLSHSTHSPLPPRDRFHPRHTQLTATRLR